MQVYWGSGGIAPRILTSELDGCEESASRPGRFTSREGAPGTHLIAGWKLQNLQSSPNNNRAIRWSRMEWWYTKHV
jgi:hypothetical protein